MRIPYEIIGNKKVNMKQINEYLKSANEFFNDMYENASNKYERIYYEDCKNLMLNRNGMTDCTDLQKSLFDNFDKLTDDESKRIAKHFASKLTAEHQLTLDEHLNL